MITIEVTLKNKLGLHARASAKFVNTALKYIGNIFIIKDNKKINGKSIMAVMSLGAVYGEKLILEINGQDEQDLSRSIVTLIDSKFGEAE